MFAAAIAYNVRKKETPIFHLKFGNKIAEKQFLGPMAARSPSFFFISKQEPLIAPVV